MEEFDLSKIDDMLSSGAEQAPSVNNNQNYNNYNKYNNYKKSDYKNYKKKEPKVYTPVKPDPSKFIASPIKTFTIDLKSIIAGGKEETAVKLAKVLFSKGYAYRSPLEIKGNESYNNLELEIRRLENANVEGFKVWANMEVEQTQGLKIMLEEPTELAYQYAFNYNPHFEKMTDIIKTFMARQMHVYLGKELLQPVNVVITYTKCGSLKLSKTFDFKASGQASGYIKMANELGSSLFNISNPNFTNDFGTYMRSATNN